MNNEIRRFGCFERRNCKLCERINANNGITVPTLAFTRIIDNFQPVEPETKLVANVTFDKEQMEELVEKAKADVLAQVERLKGEWIPITEKLPNTLGVYNVTRKLKEGETIYFISDASYFDGQNTWYADTGINHGRPYLTDVIAWQSLPEPYKKGGENNGNT